jgi:hypothetical protein
MHNVVRDRKRMSWWLNFRVIGSEGFDRGAQPAAVLQSLVSMPLTT